jgi:hypothetical protein
LIVKTKQQLKADAMPEKAQSLELLQKDFAMYRRLNGYEVYRRR